MKRLLLLACLLLTSCTTQTLNFKSHAFPSAIDTVSQTDSASTKKTLLLETPVVARDYKTISDSLLDVEVTFRIPRKKTKKIKGTATITNPNSEFVKWNWKSIILKINEEEVHSALPNSDLVTYMYFLNISANSKETFELEWNLSESQIVTSVELAEKM